DGLPVPAHPKPRHARGAAQARRTDHRGEGRGKSIGDCGGPVGEGAGRHARGLPAPGGGDARSPQSSPGEAEAGELTAGGWRVILPENREPLFGVLRRGWTSSVNQSVGTSWPSPLAFAFR